MYPVKWTGTIALVFEVIAFSKRSTFIQKVSLQSTKTGIAPSSIIAPTVATKVFAAVITSSPKPIPLAFNASLIASVPELTPIACFDPINCANFCSNSVKGFPSVKSPVETKLLSCSHKSSAFSNCCFRYEYLTFIGLLHIQ